MAYLEQHHPDTHHDAPHRPGFARWAWLAAAIVVAFLIVYSTAAFIGTQPDDKVPELTPETPAGAQQTAPDLPKDHLPEK